MEEITYNVADSMLESARHEILAEDIIKKLRPSLEQYAVEVRSFVRESMVRGFDRNMVSHSIAVFHVEVMNLVAMAEDSIALSNSPKTKILESELQALKASIGMFVKISEQIILQKPGLDSQMIFEKIGRIK